MKVSIPVLVFLSVFASCAVTNKSSKNKNEWISLFDGKTLSGWHGYNKGDAPVTNWTIIDGALVCLGASAHDTGGDIVTDRQFDNFELEWEWKVDKGSNSGVMYHVVEDKKYKGPYETGPEYQIIDDVNFPGKLEAWQQAGADYAMNLAAPNKKLKAAGNWNHSKIVFNKGLVEHWLNGEKIVAFEAWTGAWNEKRTTGKWKDYPDYGKAKTGHIALQDHGNKAYFKNIRIKQL
ncbi:3-keto-disaccharide hydrolase [Niabella aquatica]